MLVGLAMVRRDAGSLTKAVSVLDDALATCERAELDRIGLGSTLSGPLQSAGIAGEAAA